MGGAKYITAPPPFEWGGAMPPPGPPIADPMFLTDISKLDINIDTWILDNFLIFSKPLNGVLDLDFALASFS